MMTPEARRTPPIDGSEAQTLVGMLNLHRDTLRWKCSGLTDEQLHHTMPPTSMTLAGLVLHLTLVEAGWFDLDYPDGVIGAGARRDVRPAWDELVDWDDENWTWDHAKDFSVEQLWAWYDEAVAVSDEVTRQVLASPDGLSTRSTDPESPVSMRWVLCHMIEEYARHNGHADLLRQSVDGATGE